MEITIVNIMLACIITGVCAIKLGWEGFVGALVGNILYYACIRQALPFGL